MCGIAGKFYFNGDGEVEESLLKKMADRIAHRGPDSDGYYISERNQCGLAFRRLAIIDLRPEGNQPMCNEDGTVWVIFNGEIYNFEDLRKELERKGHQFRSRTDTECLVHLYEEHQGAMLPKLRGMFAFALWDEKRKRLLLARDRFGKKPLKYVIQAHAVIFASELKAILADPSVSVEPDKEAIWDYLSFQYVPTPKTGFVGIAKLPPGHYLIADRNGVSKPEPYFTLSLTEKLNLSEREWEERIVEKFSEAVKLRLMSDVPLGAFLSGGVDSSAVVASMAQQSATPVKTFSVGFEESGPSTLLGASYNELPYARKVAELFKTDHREFIVKPAIIEILPKVVWHYEEPYADSSALPTWYVAQEARKLVTVGLNGDGGDENFGGYVRYAAFNLFLHYRQLPAGVRRIVLQPLLKLAASFSPQMRKEKLRRLVQTLESPPEEVYFALVSVLSHEEKLRLVKSSWFHNVVSSRIVSAKMRASKTLDLMDQVFYADVTGYLPDDLLVKMDIATMAHSLEARSPFLDHEFVELLAQMPSSLKVQGLQTKMFAKKIFGKWFPPGFFNRPKQGFSWPMGKWLRGALRQFVASRLINPRFLKLEIFEEKALLRLIEQHNEGKSDHSYVLWSLVCLAEWFDIFFENSKPF